MHVPTENDHGVTPATFREFVSNAPHHPRNVIAVLHQSPFPDDDPRTEALRRFFETGCKKIEGLKTGWARREFEKGLVNPTQRVELTYKEGFGRAREHLLGEWACHASDTPAEVLFIEASCVQGEVVSVWHYTCTLYSTGNADHGRWTEEAPETQEDLVCILQGDCTYNAPASMKLAKHYVAEHDAPLLPTLAEAVAATEAEPT